MIIVQDGIKIIIDNSEKRICEFSEIEQEKIKEAYNIAENKMKTAGFDIIKLTNEGSSIVPALLLSSMAGVFLYGENPINITGSILLDKNYKYYEENSALSAPLSISKGSITIDRCELSAEEIKKLHIILNKHQELIEEIKDVPTHLIDEMEDVINNPMIRTEELKKFFRIDPPENNPSSLSFQKLQKSSPEHKK